MSRPLFKDFEEVSSKAWKQKIQVDLKGGDYNENLIWESPEGIHVKPFYHQDDSNIVENSYSIKTDNWKIGQELIVNDITNTINSSIDCASRGAEAISYSISKSKIDIDSILKVRKGESSFTVPDKPRFFRHYHFRDVCILENDKEIIFDEYRDIYLLNVEHRRVGRITSGSKLVTVTERYKRKFLE